MTEFKFIEGDLPEPVRSRQSSDLVAEFAEALRSNPGKWAKYPQALKLGSAKAAASNIRRCDPRAAKPFVAGGFDARVHEAVLYVRFIGGES